MKYEKFEDWLETLVGADKDNVLEVWYDHVAKYNNDNNYQPKVPGFDPSRRWRHSCSSWSRSGSATLAFGQVTASLSSTATQKPSATPPTRS